MKIIISCMDGRSEIISLSQIDSILMEDKYIAIRGIKIDIAILYEDIKSIVIA